MKLVVSPAAEADLAEIHGYSLAEWGAAQAATYIDTLIARMKWLALDRSRWRPRDDLRPGLRPGLYGQLEGRHLILYREAGGRLQIIRVLHQRMDPARHLAP